MVTPSPGSHTAAENIVGQPFSPFCNFAGCCSCCCSCSGVGTFSVPGTESTFSVDGARVFAPRTTNLAAGILLFSSGVDQILSEEVHSDEEEEASEEGSPRAVSARVISAM